jgi:hypothetical protein
MTMLGNRDRLARIEALADDAQQHIEEARRALRRLDDLLADGDDDLSPWYAQQSIEEADSHVYAIQEAIRLGWQIDEAGEPR